MRKLPFTLTKRQWAGAACIYIAGLGYAAEIIIPFTPLPHKVETFAAVLVAAEICFFIGIFLLGRQTYEQAKTYLKGLLTKDK